MTTLETDCFTANNFVRFDSHFTNVFQVYETSRNTVFEIFPSTTGPQLFEDWITLST